MRLFKFFGELSFVATFQYPIMSTQPQRGAGRSCDQCKTERAVLRRPKNNAQLCKACFFELFEAEVHATITENALFSRGQRVAIAASGGKGE